MARHQGTFSDNYDDAYMNKDRVRPGGGYSSDDVRGTKTSLSEEGHNDDDDLGTHSHEAYGGNKYNPSIPDDDARYDALKPQNYGRRATDDISQDADEHRFESGMYGSQSSVKSYDLQRQYRNSQAKNSEAPHFQTRQPLSGRDRFGNQSGPQHGRGNYDSSSQMSYSGRPTDDRSDRGNTQRSSDDRRQNPHNTPYDRDWR